MFSQIIEASLAELLEMKKVNAAIFDQGSSPERHYLRVVLSFLKNDRRELGKQLLQISEKRDGSYNWEMLYQLSALRLDIREQALNHKRVEQIQSLLSKRESKWHGEALILMGYYFEKISNNLEDSLSSYEQSTIHLERIGARRKALKARLNALAIQTQLNPDPVYILDYKILLKKALLIDDFIVAGICLNNISREYQILGASTVALKYVNQSLEYLENDFGTLHYCAALAQRCHLLFELGRLGEAKLDYESLKVSNLDECKTYIEVIDVLFNESAEVHRQYLSSSWEERLDHLHPYQGSLSELEERGCNLNCVTA